jgi:hypothetical protein
MRQAVESRLEQFSSATNKEERAAIILEVLQETGLSGGKFLKEDPGKRGWWEEVDQEVAKVKVGFCFRDLKASSKIATTVKASATTVAGTSTRAPHPHVSMLPSDVSEQQDLHLSMGYQVPVSNFKRLKLNQEFDCSTFAFLEEYSSFGPKRQKTSHSHDNCQCLF